jgi:hypothetical protein
VNLVDRLMQALTGIPGLGDLAPGRLRRQHPELFGVANTRFDQARASTRIADETVFVDDATVIAPAYTAHTQGTVRFSGAADLRGTFVASEPLSADLVGAVREARYLTDDRGRITVPFHLTGVAPDLRVQVEAGILTRALQRALGDVNAPRTKELLRRGLERLLGR